MEVLNQVWIVGELPWSRGMEVYKRSNGYNIYLREDNSVEVCKDWEHCETSLLHLDKNWYALSKKEAKSRWEEFKQNVVNNELFDEVEILEIMSLEYSEEVIL